MLNFKPATSILVTSFVLGAAASMPASWAGPNDFFGSGPTLPGAVGSLDTPADTPGGSLVGGKSTAAPQAAPVGNVTAGGGKETTPGVGADNTADEKRMQKKFKSNIAYYKSLIAKGEAMMQKAPNKDDKNYKKGKIIKETGEKHLTDLQTNSPYQLDAGLDDTKKKKKDNDGKPQM